MGVTIHRVPREEIWKRWPLFYEGVQVCLSKSESRTAPDVLADWCSPEGEELYVLMIDAREFAGFITLRVFDFAWEVWGTIGMLFVSPRFHKHGVLRQGLPLLEERLRHRGCTHMNYFTLRRGFERLAPKLGFRARYLEYVKEVI